MFTFCLFYSSRFYFLWDLQRKMYDDVEYKQHLWEEEIKLHVIYIV